MLKEKEVFTNKIFYYENLGLCFYNLNLFQEFANCY